MSNLTLLTLRITTPIRARTVPAMPLHLDLNAQVTLMLPQNHHLLCKMLLLKDQSQLPLKLTRCTSNSTAVVFLITLQNAAPALTTEYWLLDTETTQTQETTTGSLRTLGVHHGEKTATSDLLETCPLTELECAVSKCNQSTPTHELE